MYVRARMRGYDRLCMCLLHTDFTRSARTATLIGVFQEGHGASADVAAPTPSRAGAIDGSLAIQEAMYFASVASFRVRLARKKDVVVTLLLPCD